MKKILITVFVMVLLIYTLSACSASVSEELIEVSESPNGIHSVEAYLVNGGATVDWAVKVYLVDDSNKTIIFNQYHKSTANIKWIDDNRIIINDIELDLSKGETYDWRKQ